MNIGGPAVQVTGLMQTINSKIFEQKLITGYVDSNEADYLIENSIEIPVTRIDGLGRSLKPFADLMALLKLIKITQEFRPNIIHTHTAKAGVLGRLCWLFLGYKPKLVHTFHGHLLKGYFGRVKTKLVIIVEKNLGFITDKFFAVGNQVALDLLEAGIGDTAKFQIMPPGLTLKDIPNRFDTALKYNLDPSKFYCTFLGRVTDIKQPLRFLEIAKYAKNAKIPVEFLLVGEGELLETCKSFINENKLSVTCLGWINSVEDVLSLTDCMLLTSKNEGMPLSLIQAGMAGIPTISTNVGSVSEVILDNETGFILPYSPEKFIEKISMLIFDVEKRQFLAKRALEYTMQNFSTARLTSDHETAYLRLLNYK